MIDIHCHILPGQDDGPRTLADALEMIRMAAARGTTDIVASPHASPQFSFNPVEVTHKIAELQREVGTEIRIHHGCELHLTPENIDAAIQAPRDYSINHNGYVLLEFSDFLVPPTTAEILGRMLRAGLQPIVAHPERNPLLRNRLPDLQNWVRMGCLTQVTAQSLTGRYGKAAQKSSHALMRLGLVHFLASDAHDCKQRPPSLDVIFEHVRRRHGEGVAQMLLEENPRAALEGKGLRMDLIPAAGGPRSKRWFTF